MIHETGHAVMNLLLDGKVHYIALFANTEGVTVTSYSSFFSGFMTSIAGYVSASAMVLLFAFLWKTKRHRSILYILLLFSTVNLLLWVRNVYGIFWLVLFIALLVWLVVKCKDAEWISHITFALMLLLLISSTLSALDIFLLSVTSPGMAGDAANLARSTGIPALIWGVLFLGQAVAFTGLSLKMLLWSRKPRTNNRYS